MCGIAGFADFRAETPGDVMRFQALEMAGSIHHRGPDDGGAWVDVDAGIALASRRLAIIDLSMDGHQPMASGSGRYIIAFNGEIYNHRILRGELETGLTGVRPFRGASDTVVLLEAIERWGLERTLQRTVGMFAFALWDRKRRELHLVRDRMGEKPLYYGWMGETLLFGSEIKALRCHPAFVGEVDRDAVAVYLQRGYIPTPMSIYRGVAKLPPGTVLTVSSTAARSCRIHAYWSHRRMVEEALADPFTGGDDEAREQLDALLRQAVRQQMIADVPLGACLSGGIDSSIVVALMQAVSGTPVKTFTVGFDEARYNEAEHSRAVARHLGSDHTELYVSATEALKTIPCLPQLYDEPFADASQIPTHLVYELMRRHVTVGLSGDGGDELFAGYRRYQTALDMWRRMRPVPGQVRSAVGRGLEKVPAGTWRRAHELMHFGAIGAGTSQDFGHRMYLLGQTAGTRTPEALYDQLTSIYKQPLELVPGASRRETPWTDRTTWPAGLDFTHHMMFVDLLTYLPDDILVKVDRASMGTSLEARVPFLDHRVVEFAWRLPLRQKVRNRQGKWILREVLDAYVPRHLVDRPKTGFGIPLGEWLRGPLREWAEELLNERVLRDMDLIEPEPVRSMWQDYLTDGGRWQGYIWSVLMFQAWMQEERRAGAAVVSEVACHTDFG